jgi:putative transposase
MFQIDIQEQFMLAVQARILGGPRTRVTKGPGTKHTGLAMVFKLLQAAQGRWRAVNGPHLVALVRAGARFENGKLIERPDQTPDKEAGEDVDKVAA